MNYIEMARTWKIILLNLFAYDLPLKYILTSTNTKVSVSQINVRNKRHSRQAKFKRKILNSHDAKKVYNNYNSLYIYLSRSRKPSSGELNIPTRIRRHSIEFSIRFTVAWVSRRCSDWRWFDRDLFSHEQYSALAIGPLQIASNFLEPSLLQV